METIPSIVVALLALLALGIAYSLGRSDGKGNPVELASLAFRMPPSNVFVLEGMIPSPDGYTVYEARGRFSGERILCYADSKTKILRKYNLKVGEYFSVSTNGDDALEIVFHDKDEKIDVSTIPLPYPYANNQMLI